MAFLGLPAQSQQRDPQFLSKDHRSNLDSFRRLSEPIDDSSVGKWRTALDTSEKAVFAKRSRRALAHYGYDS